MRPQPSLVRTETHRCYETMAADQMAAVNGAARPCPTPSRQAGDVVVISERLLHGALRWRPRDRERRFLTCRCRARETAHRLPALRYKSLY